MTDNSYSPSAGERKARALADLAAIEAGQKRRQRVLQSDHEDADEILLRLIGDDEIRQAFDGIEKWYA